MVALRLWLRSTYPGTIWEGGVDVVIDQYMRGEQVCMLDGVVYASSLSAALAQLERERRREDAIAAFGAPVVPFGLDKL